MQQAETSVSLQNLLLKRQQSKFESPQASLKFPSPSFPKNSERRKQHIQHPKSETWHKSSECNSDLHKEHRRSRSHRNKFCWFNYKGNLHRIAVDDITELEIQNPIRAYEHVTRCLVHNRRCCHLVDRLPLPRPRQEMFDPRCKLHIQLQKLITENTYRNCLKTIE